MADRPRIDANANGTPRNADEGPSAPAREPLAPPWASQKVRQEPREEDSQDRLDVFISYNQKDKETADWISRILKDAGYHVQYQHQDFRPGDEFRRDIDDRLRRARRVIAVVSAASLGSTYCRKEWDAAADKLMPIRIERVSVDGLLSNKTFVDLFGAGMDREDHRRDTLLAAMVGRQIVMGKDGTTSSIDLPPRCSPFVGREDLLTGIYNHFFGPRIGSGARRLTLAGISGVGKTALAVDYGYRMREHAQYSRVWFIQAGDLKTLETQLWQVVSEMQIPRQDQPLVERLSQSLAREREWLIILDAAPDLAGVNDYIRGSQQGHILITSENPSTWGRANVLEVTGWSLEEGVRFLMQETGTEDRRAAEDLVEECDAHPERLTQAASYIDRTGVSVGKYLQIYRERQVELNDKFAAALALALDRLEGNPLALDILRLSAFFGPERVPTTLLKHGLAVVVGRPIDDTQLDHAVQPLLQFSIARRDDLHLTFSRLMQGQVRSSLEHRGDAARWVGAALAALDQMFPQISKLGDPAVWVRANEIVPHLLAATGAARLLNVAPAIVGRLLSRAGHYMASPARLGAARESSNLRTLRGPVSSSDAVGRTMLQDAVRILGATESDPLDRSEAIAELALLDRAQGRFNEAIPALTEALEIARQAAGPGSAIVAMRLTQLARAQRDAGRVSLACRNLQTALDIASAAGADGRDTLAEALASYGIALSFQGRHREAVEHLKRSVTLEEAIFGPDSLDVSLTLVSLTRAQAAYGDLTSARETIHRMVRIDRVIYGEASAARCPGLLRAAGQAIDADDPQEAETWAAECIALASVEARRDDPTVANAYLYRALADRLNSGNQWRMLLERAGEAIVAAGLPNIRPRLTLAGCLLDDGNLREATALAAQVQRDLHGTDDWTAAADAALFEAQVRTEAGELELAERGLRSLIGTLEPQTDINESLLVAAYLTLGRTLFHRHEEALSVYKTVERLAIERGRVLDCASARVGIGRVLLAEGRIEEAISAFREGSDQRRDHLIKGHPAIVDVQLELARAEGARGNRMEARQQLEMAVAAAAQLSGARSLEIGRLYVRVAEVLASFGRNVEATARIEEGLRTLRDSAQRPADSLGATIDAAYCMLTIGNLARASELAVSARALAHELPVRWLDRARASEVVARVAVETRDHAAARASADELIGMLSADPDMPPRLKASCWLLVADIEPGVEQKRRALEQAAGLNVDSLGMSRKAIRLEAARYASHSEALSLAEQLLSDELDVSLRLEIIKVLIPSALGTGDHQRATKYVDEAAALLDQIQDPLAHLAHRTWIADAFRRVGNADDAAATRSAIAERLLECRTRVPSLDARRIARLYEDLANLYSDVGDETAAIDALEQAVDLYLKAEDRGALTLVMNQLATTASRTGQKEMSRAWVERLERELPLLVNGKDAVRAQVWVGLRYLELGKPALAREAVERALSEWERLPGRDPSIASQFLIPLIRACSALGDGDAANRYAERAVDNCLVDERAADEGLLNALLDLASSRTADAVGFGTVVSLARRLVEQRLPPDAGAEVLARLADIYAKNQDWDQLALELLEDASSRLRTADVFDSRVLALVATLHASALAAVERTGDAVRTLEAARDRLHTGEDQESLVEVLAALGDCQLAENPGSAATSFQRAVDILDSLQAPLPSRLHLLTSLARAQMQSGARLDGVRTLRRAFAMTEDEALQASVQAVGALCRVASALFRDADDERRATTVLSKALHFNERLTSAQSPETAGLPAVIDAVYRIRGVAAAIPLIESALRAAPEAEGPLEALMNLVVNADLKAVDILTVVTGPEDPRVLASNAELLAQAFQYKKRTDDAKAVLRGALERLQSFDTASHTEQVDLLAALSELDTTDDLHEARSMLESALALAREYGESAAKISDLQERLGLVLWEADMVQPSVDILEKVERRSEAAELLVNIGRTMIGRHEAAVDGLTRLVGQASDPERLYWLAVAESGCGQKQAALDTLAQAMGAGGDAPDTLLLCAEICNDIAEYEGAITYARAAVAIDSNNARAYSAMAWALQHLGPARADECEAAFQKSFDLSSTEDRCYALKGRADARRMLGKEREARSDYEQVLELLKPGQDHALEGWARYNLGHYDLALTSFHLAIEGDPDDIAVRFDLSLCQAVSRMPEAAESYRTTLTSLEQREPRGRLAPLRVALNDLRTAEFVHEELKTDAAFRTIVDEVEERRQRTEEIVVRPILPAIPKIEPVTQDEKS